MTGLEIFLIMFSGLVFLGSCWFILFPESAQKTVTWWTAMPRGISITAGVAQIILGIAVVIEAVRKVENVVIVAAVVIGLLFVLKGSIYFSRNGVAAVGERFTSSHSTVWLRVLGGLGILAVLFLTFVIYGG